MTHQIDVLVGQKIRQRRWMIDMTQKQLADLVGVKFQQVQKYETGMNRVSASRLFEISKALQVSISFFFQDAAIAEEEKISVSSDQSNVQSDLFMGREAHELLRCYYSWPKEQRRRLFDLTRSISKVNAA